MGDERLQTHGCPHTGLTQRGKVVRVALRRWLVALAVDAHGRKVRVVEREAVQGVDFSETKQKSKSRRRKQNGELLVGAFRLSRIPFSLDEQPPPKQGKQALTAARVCRDVA